jgi:hypothetical protein
MVEHVGQEENKNDNQEERPGDQDALLVVV